MNDIKTKSEKQRNWVERILESVPGFKGYLQKERSRESDQLERAYISRKLLEQIDDVRSIARQLTQEGRLELLDELDRVEKRIRRVADRIKHADYGYSGFFDTIKVEDEELDKLYKFDVATLEAAENIAEGLKQLSDVLSEPEKLEKRIKNLQSEIRKLDENWSDRENLISDKQESSNSSS